MDQCVVNLLQRTYSCRKWEITWIPCKHDIAAMNDKINNMEECGDPRDWMHEYYKLSTWKEMYKFKFNPINGRNIWRNSPCPFTLTHHHQVMYLYFYFWYLLTYV